MEEPFFVRTGGSLAITGSTFRENTIAARHRFGSAITLWSARFNPSTGTISRCSFFGNSAPGSSSGTVFAHSYVTLNVSNSVFARNTMGGGAAVYSIGDGGTFINNTVYDNRDRSSTGAAVRLGGGSSTWVVANNIIYEIRGRINWDLLLVRRQDDGV